MSKEITSKNFQSVLSTTLRSVKSMRGKVQELIGFAVRHYAGEGNGNTLYLSKLMVAVIGTAGLNTRGIQAYIQSAANVVWTKDSDGNPVFKKVTKAGDNPATFNSNVIATPWYEWVVENLGSNNAQSDWTMDKYIASVIATIKKHNADPKEFAKLLTKKIAA